MASVIPTPLTTTFTPSPSCLTDIHWATDSSWYVLGEYNTACVPHGTATNAILPNPTLSSYFSPALYCPSGFTIACSSEVATSSDIETRAYCCPDLVGVQLFSQTQFTCVTSPPGWGAWSSYGCSAQWGSLVSESPFTIVVTDGQGTRTTTTSETEIHGGINAYSVQIRWKASDLEAAARTTSTSTSNNPDSAGINSATTSASQSAGPTTGSSAPTSTSEGQTHAQGQNSGTLSTGAKAAIGVVVPLAVIFAVLAGLYVWRRRRHTKDRGMLAVESDSKALPPAQTMSQTRYEAADGSDHARYSEMSDKPAQVRQELPASEPMTR